MVTPDQISLLLAPNPPNQYIFRKLLIIVIQTLPKALQTQALTALTSNFGLVGLVWQVSFGRFGFLGLVW